MSQLAQVSNPVPSAQESINTCKALFSTGHKRNQIKIAFNSLTVRARGMICIAGGLPVADCHRSFEDFNDIELQKIRRGMIELKGITKRFDTKVGDVNKLRPSHFQA